MAQLWASSNYAMKYVSTGDPSGVPSLYFMMGNYIGKYLINNVGYPFANTNDWGFLLHNGAATQFDTMTMDQYRPRELGLSGIVNNQPTVYFIDRETGQFKQVMSLSGTGAITAFA